MNTNLTVSAAGAASVHLEPLASVAAAAPAAPGAAPGFDGKDLRADAPAALAVTPPVFVPVTVDQVDAKLGPILAAAEESFDPISDGQHFFAGYVDGARTLADVQAAFEARVAEHNELLDYVRVLPQSGRDAVHELAERIEAMKDWAEGPAVDHLTAIAEAVRLAADVETSTAYLVEVAATGPQYGREIAALVLVGADGRCYAIESEAVG